MIRVKTLAAALVIAASAVAASGAPVEPEFPLGPWVRAGRPVVVRVRGATRVRGGGSPWALPVGERGDEFVLQVPRADITLRELEIDESGAVRRAAVAVRSLPEASPLVATFDPPGAGEIVLPRKELPTVREAWLIFDALKGRPDGLTPAESNAIDAWRASPRPGEADAPYEPLTWAPGPGAFRAAADVASRAPRLPRDISLVLLFTAVAEVSLLLLAARRSPKVRALWLAGPPLATLVWLTAGGRLPGDVSAVTFRLDGPSWRLYVVRFDAARGGEVSFRVPDAATAPAILRFDGDDRSGVEASAGRDVVLPIPAGQSRVVAWSVPVEAGVGSDDPDAAPAGTALASERQAAWIVSSLGLRVTGVGGPAEDEPFTRRAGFRPVEGAAFSVAPARSGRK